MVDIKHKTQVKVRYAETDKMGVVYNGNYFTYFEVGRTELMRQYGLVYTDLEKAGYYLPLLESHANYIKSAFYDDILDIEAKLNWQSGAKLKFEYSIYRNEELVCQGHTLHCFQSVDTMRPMRPPQIFIETVNNIQKNGNSM